MRRAASFDRTGSFRYSLVRAWDDALARLALVGLNPSTADHRADDPTIRRCIGFARAWGFGSVEVVNLFAFRATHPRDLLAAADPIGPRNDAAIARAVERSQLALLAWGNHGTHLGRDKVVARLIAETGVPRAHLGYTKQAQPRHPLYVAGSTPPRVSIAHTPAPA